MHAARWFIALLAISWSVGAIAQDEQPEPSVPAATIAAIEALIATVEADEALDEAERTAAIGLYRDALEQLNLAESSAAAAAESRRLAGEAPGLLETIRAELSEPSAAPRPQAPEGATLTQLEQGLAQATADLGAARQAVEQLRAETTVRRDRAGVIPDEIAIARQRLGELDESLQARPAGTEPPTVAAARAMFTAAERRAVANKLEALEAEQTSLDARRELLPARLDRALRRATETEQLAATWQEWVNRRQEAEADFAAEEAERLRQEAAHQHAALQEFAAEIQQQAEERARDGGTLERIAAATSDTTVAEAQLSLIRSNYSSVKKRIDRSGLNRATGLLLRGYYGELPDATELRRSLAATRRELEEAEYAIIEHDDAREGAGDIPARVELISDRIAELGGTDDWDGVLAAARELAETRRDLLNLVYDDAFRHREALYELESATSDLLAATEAFGGYIGERILWIRSIQGGRAPRIDDLRGSIAWLTDADAWSATARATTRELSDRWALTSLGVLVIGSLFWTRHRSRRRLKTLAARVGNFRTDSLRATVEALALTAVAALPIATTLWWLGWALAWPAGQPDQALAVGAGLQAGGYFMFPLAIVRAVIRPGGIAEAHFRWPASAVKLARGRLRWLIPSLVPLVIVVASIERSGDERWVASLGRMAFNLALLVFAVFVFQTLRLKGPLMAHLIRRRPGGWIDRLRYVWFPALVGIPLALIVVSWLGYFYTATQLESRLERTIGLVLVLMLVNGLLGRWLFVARRRVAVEDARRRREQAMAEAKAKPVEEGEAPTETPPPIDEDKLDLPAISAQTRQLFRTAIAVGAVLGLFAIWVDVLPALRILDRVEIWPEQRVLASDDNAPLPILEAGRFTATERDDELRTGAQPSPSPAGNEGSAPAIPARGPIQVPSGTSDATAPAEEAPVTLADLGLAIVLLIATYVAFRNLPGLVEIMILQRLPLDAGSRFALSTVLRYSIAIIGVTVTLSAMNIGWGRVQWLAAALTFGLAFGLQEIFANFVSGLIILAERPIRIGDTVTVQDVTGTVTRIRMRATTITDWDRKELVIPNKNFITGDVINWSLSDPMLRATITVGVGYNEDVDLAEATLLRIAHEHPAVQKDPKPHVLFREFGDSTLNFDLRVFLPHIDYWFTTRHELHMAIIKAFRKNKIEIAFPQRDLHVRSIGELGDLIRMRDDSSPDEPDTPAPRV